jgi:hypothetical protein
LAPRSSEGNGTEIGGPSGGNSLKACGLPPSMYAGNNRCAAAAEMGIAQPSFSKTTHAEHFNMCLLMDVAEKRAYAKPWW